MEFIALHRYTRMAFHAAVILKKQTKVSFPAASPVRKPDKTLGALNRLHPTNIGNTRLRFERFYTSRP
jgi:hypothetical protein